MVSLKTPVVEQADVDCDGCCRIDALPLHHGGTLSDVVVRYELAGNPDGPLVVVLGGISASRHVFAHEADDRPGWWQDHVGPGRAVDSTRFRILGFDFLGGNGATTGPSQSDEDVFPAISTFDQARCLVALLDHLGIARLHALVGASYGGMVGLALAARWPSRVDRLVVVSAANAPSPMGTAWRALQRRILRLGMANGSTREAICLSRGLAMTTYRSPEEFHQRFDGPPRQTESGYCFPVEEYLASRGEAFADCFHPGAFLCLSESIDLHQVEESEIHTPTTLIAVSSDQLVPIPQMRALARNMAHPARLFEIDSLYGHDAFLKEVDQLHPLISNALI